MTSVPLRIRIAVPLLLLLVTAFSVATLLYNAPPSPARNRIATPAAQALQPFFWQDWHLFGPAPPTRDGRIYLTAQVRDDHGAVRETTPVEIEEKIDKAPRNFRLNPTKTPGIMLAFNSSANNFARSAGDIKKMPAARQPAAMKDLEKGYTNFFREVQRFLSSSAGSLYRGQQIVAVKGTFKSRAVLPFSQRYQRPTPPQPEQDLLDTTWLPYVPGVAR
jgi:hypothetical protein